MTEPQVVPTEQADQKVEEQDSTTEQPKTFDAEYVANLRKENAKYRTEAKAATSEVEKIRAASMSESEKAVAEAKTAGRAEAVTEFGKRLARTEFDAAAGRRNPDFDSVSALEWVDLSLFVGEDGEPNTKAIKAAVERLVPTPAEGTPSFDGGARSTTPVSPGMNGLIRKAAGRA